jgi:hypothetical protein
MITAVRTSNPSGFPDCFYSTVFILKQTEAGLWDHDDVCLCTHPCQLSNAWTNPYETSYVHHGTWAQLSEVLRKSFLSVSVFACVSRLSLLGYGWVKTLQRQEYACNSRIFWYVISMQSASYQTKIGEYFFPQILAFNKFQSAKTEFTLTYAPFLQTTDNSLSNISLKSIEYFSSQEKPSSSTCSEYYTANNRIWDHSPAITQDLRATEASRYKEYFYVHWDLPLVQVHPRICTSETGRENTLHEARETLQTLASE